jgi:hypothetical protein
MPFEPKLVQPDDAPLKADGEIDLPDNLAALGEQLRDDALHLAACYPAAGRELGLLSQTRAGSRSRSWTKIAVLVSTAAATLLVSVATIRQFSGPRATRQTVSALAAIHTPAEASALDAARAADPASPALPVPAVSSTSVSLTELSGPEFEALLDLWQREPQDAQVTGISF